MSINVKPEILVWARESSGFSVDEAAKKLGLSDSVKSSSDDKLLAMEAGEKQPTRNQLNAFAKLYKRPLLTFYLPEPPKASKRGHDFRQTPEKRGQRENAILDALLRDMQARQEMVRDILLDDDSFEKNDFVGSVNIADGVDIVVQAMSTKLGFDFTDLVTRKGGPDDLFKRLRIAAENIGIFVLVLSDLGSHHTAIQANVFRGFAIADKTAPFVVINPKDAKSARSFTLMHELAHIWLGQTGVSGSLSTDAPTNKNAKIERFCNDVAAEFLLPEEHFRINTPSFDKTDVEAARATIDLIASRWSISEPMVAYRLQRRGELSANAYQTLRDEYYSRWQAKVKRDKEKQKTGAPPHFILKQFSLGNALVEVVYRTVRENNLPHTKAATLLGSKPGAVEPFLKRFEAKRGSYVSSLAGQM